MDVLRQPTSCPALSDESIIALFWQRAENAIAETERKYGKYLQIIAYNIVHDLQDCEECLNDTYLAAWNTIPPERPNALKAFLTVLLRRIAVNRYHANRRKGHIPSEMTVSLSELEFLLTEKDSTEAVLDARLLEDVISDFVRSLPERRQYIFMSRYYVCAPIDTIAGDLGLSRSMVNKELAAIRTALREKLQKEGYVL